MLVLDLADDLLDQILQRHEPVDVAELVDDQRHLQPAAPQLLEQLIELERLRHHQRRLHHVGDRQRATPLERHRHRVLDVSDPDEALPLRHREPRMTACPCLLDHRKNGRIRLKGADTAARGHDLVRPALGEVQRALQQRRRAHLQRPLRRRVADQRSQLLGRPGRGKLLLRLDPEPPEHGVRRPVEEPHDRPRRNGERALEALHGPRGRQRPRDRKVLRHQLAEHHRDPGRQRERNHERNPGHGIARHAGRLERTVDEPRDRWFGQEPDQQIRQRDPDLRGR
jgi:hypothetical protein